MSDKLELKEVLYALDTKDRGFYYKLGDKHRKEYAPFVLMRFLSSASSPNMHKYHLLAVNDLVNRNFWDLTKYPDLQHQLMCMVGTGSKQFHPWIAPPKRGNSDKIAQLFKKVYPDLNEFELQILYKNTTENDIINLCESYGMTDDEIKEIINSFEKVKK